MPTEEANAIFSSCVVASQLLQRDDGRSGRGTMMERCYVVTIALNMGIREYKNSGCCWYGRTVRPFRLVRGRCLRVSKLNLDSFRWKLSPTELGWLLDARMCSCLAFVWQNDHHHGRTADVGS